MIPLILFTYQYKDHLGNNRLSYADSNGNGRIDTPSNTGVAVWEETFEDKSKANNDWDGSGNSWGWEITDIVSDKAHSGSKSGMLQNTAGTHREIVTHSNEWVNINNSKPTLYKYSGWVFIEHYNHYAEIFFFMKKEGETAYYTQFDRIGTPKRGKWVFLEKVVMVPENIKTINIRIDNDGTSSSKVWFDDLKIEKLDLSQNEIVSETNYYPFGLAHKGYNEHSKSSNLGEQFKFNGKEHQNEFDINFTDYGWRNYMSDIGRWISPDPLTEEFSDWSPYNYGMNNPVRYIDVDGLYSTEEWKKDNGITDDDLVTLYSASSNSSSENNNTESSSATENGDCCDTKFDITIAQRTADAKGEDVVAMQNEYMTALEDDKIIQATGMIGAEVMMGVVPVFKGLKIASKLKVPVYRVYGGGSSMYGKSYSLINPKYVPNYRNFAGLPNTNTGQYLLKGKIPLKDIHVGRSFAAPLKGKTGGLPLELYQNFNQLSNPANIIIKKPF